MIIGGTRGGGLYALWEVLLPTSHAITHGFDKCLTFIYSQATKLSWSHNDRGPVTVWRHLYRCSWLYRATHTLWFYHSQEGDTIGNCRISPFV